MKNSSLQLALNAILLVAVGVLFYLHFAQKSAAPTAAPAAATTEEAAPAADTAATVVATVDSATKPAAAAPATAAKPADGALRKVAYVESATLLDGYKGMQDARRSFERKAATWQKQHETAVRALQAAVQSYQKMAPSMTDEQRATAEQRLAAQEQQVAQQQQKLQQQAQEEEAKMGEQVLGKVNKLLEGYGKESGYDLILVAGNGTIAYARPGLNITSLVLKRLNAQYAAGRK